MITTDEQYYALPALQKIGSFFARWTSHISDILRASSAKEARTYCGDKICAPSRISRASLSAAERGVRVSGV